MIGAQENITSYDSATPVINETCLLLLSEESHHTLSIILYLSLRCLLLFAARSVVL